MKLEQLTYFLEAAKHEHMGKAAKALHISPGAICHSVSLLEEELGRSLFEKHGRRIQLTDHGKALAERARKLLMEVQNIQEELSSDSLELRGHFRLAGTHMLCGKFLVPQWASVQNKNPKLTAEVFTLRSSQVATGIINGEYDFGLCFNPQSHIELNSEVLTTGRLLVALRKGHPLLKLKGSSRFNQLSQYPATLPKSFQGIEVCEKHPVFEKFKISPVTDCLVDSYELAIEKVAHSDAWGFLPDWLIEEDKRLEVLPAPSGWDASYFIAAVWPKSRILSTAMKELLETLKKAF